jgi:Subtilase family
MQAFPKSLPYGTERILTLDASRLLLAFDEPQHAKLAEKLEKRGWHLERGSHGKGALLRPVNSTRTLQWARTATGEPATADLIAKLVEELEHLRWVGPVYQLDVIAGERGLVGLAGNALMVHAADGVTGDQIAEMAKQFRLQVRAERRLGAAGHYFESKKPLQTALFDIARELREKHKKLVRDLSFNAIPFLSPAAAAENPTTEAYWNAVAPDPSQWAMVRIQAPEAWGILPGGATDTKGKPSIYVTSVDLGVWLGHPELSDRDFAHWAYDFDTLSEGFGTGANPAAPVAQPVGSTSAYTHGTATVGIAAAAWNDGGGVAGLAGRCPLAVVKLPDGYGGLDLANGIERAAVTVPVLPRPPANKQVILLPGVSDAWLVNQTQIDAAIRDAVMAGAALVVPAGNADSDVTSNGLPYPAWHPDVIAIGASDRATTEEARARDELAGGTNWWSNYGQGTSPQALAEPARQAISLVAPGVEIVTADLEPGGFNTTAPTLPADRSYWSDYFGTSAAAAHVTGAVAQLKSLYEADNLTQVQIRRILQRTADIIPGPLSAPYKFIDVTREWTMGTAPHGFPDPWHEETGFGRLNAFKALDFADVMIREQPDDAGDEPYSWGAGPFYGPDAVVSTIDVASAIANQPTAPEFQAAFGDTFDNIRNDATQAGRLEEGNTNYIYLRVKNLGPAVARNVRAKVVLASCAMGFDYPEDYNQPDGTMTGDYLAPASVVIANLPASQEVIAKMTVDVPIGSPHLCLLGSVRADNDYAFEKFDGFIANALLDPLRAGLAHGQAYERNNLVQKNLVLVNLIPPPPPPAPPPPLPPPPGPGPGPGPGEGICLGVVPFLLGTRRNLARAINLVFELEPSKDVQLHLELDAVERYYGKRFDLLAEARRAAPEDADEDAFEVLEMARVRTKLGGVLGELMLAPGSRFKPTPRPKLEPLRVDGARVVMFDKRRFIHLNERRAFVRLEKLPGIRQPVAILARAVCRGGKKLPPQVVHIWEVDDRGLRVGDLTVVFIDAAKK